MNESRLLNLKSDKNKTHLNYRVVNVDQLICGESIGSFLLLNQMMKTQQADQSFKMLASRELQFNRLIDNWSQSFIYFRGDKAKRSIEQINERISLIEFENDALFYKDQKLRSFGGRANPLKMLEFEKYFISKPFTFDSSTLFEENFANSCSQYFLEGKLISISKNDDKDWVLKCSDGLEVVTPNLYWGESRKSLFELLDNDIKDSLSEEELAVFGDLQECSVLNVTFELNKPITEKSQTFFIPQSQTHEWGHFVLDFHSPKSNRQTVVGHIFIYDTDVDEEFLGRKIKLLKRNTDRVLAGFQKAITEEKIVHLDEFWCDFSAPDELDKHDISKLPALIGSQSLVSKKNFEESEYPFLLNELRTFTK